MIQFIVLLVVSILLAIGIGYLIVKFIPLKLRGVVSFILFAISVYLGYLIYQGVMQPIKFNKQKKVRYAEVIKNLKLIRTAEEKYKENYGTYSKNKGQLLNFISKDSLAITQTRSVEEEVHVGGGITKKISVKKVDTVGYEPVKKYFEGKKYQDMFKVPGTKKEFTIETGKIEKVKGFMVPVFIAKIDKESVLNGMNKMMIKQELEAKESDQVKGAFISVGSLDEVSTGGNWPPFYDNDDKTTEKK